MLEKHLLSSFAIAACLEPAILLKNCFARVFQGIIVPWTSFLMVSWTSMLGTYFNCLANISQNRSSVVSSQEGRSFWLQHITVISLRTSLAVSITWL